MYRAPLLTVLIVAGLGCATSTTPPAPASPPASASASASPAAGRDKLPPDEIQRVVEQSFARLRDCYERGLRKNPRLEGRVSVAFAIELDGSTSEVQDKGSDLPDKEVVTCVVAGFSGLKFPSPKGDRVKFTYPIVFSPSGDTQVTPAPPGYFAGCFVRESSGGDVGKMAVECDQKVVTVVDMAAKLGDGVASRELKLFEDQQQPTTAKRSRSAPKLNGSACFQTTVDLPRGPVSMVLAPIGAHATRRVTCEERGIPGRTSPWCARAIEILAQPGAVADLLRTP